MSGSAPTRCRSLPACSAGLWLLLAWPGAAGASGAAPYLDHRSRELDFTEAGAGGSEIAGVDEVCLGWFGPSDPADPVGGDLWMAACMAVEEANATGGWEGRPFRLTPRWSENPWGTGVGSLFRMVYDEPVVALLGSMDGASTHLAEQVVAKAGLPLVSPVSTDDSVNFAGVSWVFSCAPGDAMVAASLADAVARWRVEPFLVNAIDHDSRVLARSVARAIEVEGRGVSQQLQFTPGGETFAAQLRQLAAAQPDLVVLIAGAEDSARFVRGLRRMGVTSAVLGSPGMGSRRFFTAVDGGTDGVFFPLLVAEGEGGRREAFTTGFAARTGHEPDFRALLTYDAATLLVCAVRRAGPDRDGIRRALRGLSPWTGVAGRIEWDGLGRNRRGPVGWGRWNGDGRILVCDLDGVAAPASSLASDATPGGRQRR